MGVLEVLSDPSWDPVEDLRRSYEGSGAAEEVSSGDSDVGDIVMLVTRLRCW